MLVLRSINLAELHGESSDAHVPTWPMNIAGRVAIVERDHQADLVKVNDTSGRIYIESSGAGDSSGRRMYTVGNHSYENCIVDSAGTEEPESKLPPLRCANCYGLVGHTPVPSVIVSHHDNVFTGYDIACNIRCAKTQLDRESRGANEVQKRELTHAADHLTRFAYLVGAIRLGESIQPLPDRRLLRDLGGSLSRDEYLGARADSFARTPNLIVQPVRLVYSARKD